MLIEVDLQSFADVVRLTIGQLHLQTRKNKPRRESRRAIRCPTAPTASRMESRQSPKSRVLDGAYVDALGTFGKWTGTQGTNGWPPFWGGHPPHSGWEWFESPLEKEANPTILVAGQPSHSRSTIAMLSRSEPTIDEPLIAMLSRSEPTMGDPISKAPHHDALAGEAGFRLGGRGPERPLNVTEDSH
jgi:hypothetical protein